MSKFTNSPLVEYTHISPNRTSPRNQSSITKIIVHHMAGCLTLKQFDNIVSNPNRKMSSNYAIDKDAHVGLFCEEKDRCCNFECEFCEINPRQYLQITGKKPSNKNIKELEQGLESLNLEIKQKNLVPFDNYEIVDFKED